MNSESVDKDFTFCSIRDGLIMKNIVNMQAF